MKEGRKYFLEYNSVFQENFPGTPDIHEIVSNASIILQNHDPAIHYNKPTMPHVIPIGGLFFKKKPKPLPEVKHIMSFIKKYLFVTKN